MSQESTGCHDVSRQALVSPGILAPMSATLATRMQWVLENRRKQDGDRWDAKTLSLAAGLGSSHVGQIARGSLRNPQLSTLNAIARKAGVSAAWLATGAGSPDAIDRAEPSVTTAVLGEVPIYANALGWTDAVAEFLATPEGAGTPPSVIHDAGQHSPYRLHGPVTKERVKALVGLVLAEADPMKVIRERDELRAEVERLRALEAAGAEDFERRVREAAEKRAKKTR